MTMSDSERRWVRAFPSGHKHLGLLNVDAGLKAEAAMRVGNLVPDALILDLILTSLTGKGWLSTKKSAGEVISALDRGNGTISEAVHASEDPSTSFILDGFPRTAVQAAALDRLIPINLVVHLLTPPPVIISRIANRWVHAPSGRVYNIDFNAPKVPGIDDATGEPLTKREDDNQETWRQRLRKFGETSEPLLKHYDDKGLMWRVEGNSSDEISPQLFHEIERRFA